MGQRLPPWSLLRGHLGAALLLVLGVLAGAPLQAETVRRAVLFSNAQGGEGLGQLRYTARDAQKMRDVLVDLGGFTPSHVEILANETSSAVLKRLRAVDAAVLQDKAAGFETLLFVYYSGHAKDGILRMGNTRLDLALLGGLLEDSAADVRIAVIDACGAGELTREKGGHTAPPLVVRLDDALTAHGQVIIASSAATESSQESDDIQGSFFTHYWVSGLRGDADASADGRVTLDEAYTYAYGRTVAATVNTRGGIQHPNYSYNLHGAGDVVMSNLASVGSSLTFPEEMAGRFVVFDLERQRVVAEVDKAAGKPLRIALKGGTYAIKQREHDHFLMQRLQLGGVDGDTQAQLDPTQMRRVALDKDYAKGPLVELELPGPQHGMWGLSLSGGVGAQVFYDLTLQSSAGLPTNTMAGVPSPWNRLITRPTFPSTPVASLQVRYHGIFNPHVLLGADLNLGIRDYTLVVNSGRAEVPFNTRFFMADLGVSPMWEQQWGFVRVAAGPRVSSLFTWRYFLSNAPVNNQFYLNLAPGLAAYVGMDIFRFLHLELGWRGSLSLFAIDGFKAVGYGSLTLAVHADL